MFATFSELLDILSQVVSPDIIGPYRGLNINSALIDADIDNLSADMITVF